LTEADFEGVLVGLRGTPVIVNIWASWCAPCRTETPLLERTWEAHKNDVVILGVDSKDYPASGLAFMDEFNVSYPNVFDTSGDIRYRLGLRGFPTTYVFDADGKLRTTVVGGLTEQRLAAILQDLGV
jgi:cytochrome c biogenesis protein CcmG/thiol:disulfide interchange protein DsbE